MSIRSVVTFEKPLQHLSLGDWQSRVNQLRNAADCKRQDAYEMRQSAQIMRNETRIQTDWSTYNNNMLLTDRAAEMERWTATMEAARNRLIKETALLEDEKLSTERELNSLVLPISVVSECLTMRDSRLGSELTYDDGEDELKKELSVVEANQKLLKDQCQLSWEKLTHLEEVKCKIELEICNKSEAREIDNEQLKLDRNCANLSYKPNPTRAPTNSYTYEGWLEHTRQMKALADSELEDTFSLRESLFVCREKARNSLRSQQERTEHVLRKRIFETQRARNELQWQHQKMKDEMEKCCKEIEKLQSALQDKINCLKLAETRLENRTHRSGVELCIDYVYEGLCEEVLQLRKTNDLLEQKLNHAKSTYHNVEQHCNAIEIDLGNKQHSLMTDIRCMDLRKTLKSEELSQTNRNISLTRMEKHIKIDG